jgi:purine-nucleoside phosphorylase
LTDPGLEQAEEAAAAIRSKSPLRPGIALVLGSGLGAFAQSLDKSVRLPYAQIPHFPRSTAIGHSGDLFVGVSQGVTVAVMSGRVHHYEGYTGAQLAFPVRVLGRLGVKILVLTNAAGSVNVNYKPGELMIIEDHINLMGMNPLVGAHDERLGARFFDMGDAYDAKLRKIAEKACAQAGVTVRSGTYIAFSGPSYETPAEIKMARTLGADAVGMSTVPEVIAARQLGIRVLAMSCITNMAAGVLKKPLDHKEVLAVAEKVKSSLMDVLQRVIQEAAKQL